MEMQRNRQVFIKSRNIYYAAANLHKQLAPGDGDFLLKELVFICLTDFIFDKNEGDQVVQTIKLTVQENAQVFYNKLIFKYIELPKFKKRENLLVSRLDKWLFALTNMRKSREIPISLCKDDVFKKLFYITRLANLNKEQMDAYQRAEMDRMDYLRGFTVSKMEGEKIGERKTKIAVARSMKEVGISLDIIKKCTGLTARQVAKL